MFSFAVTLFYMLTWFNYLIDSRGFGEATHIVYPINMIFYITAFVSKRECAPPPVTLPCAANSRFSPAARRTDRRYMFFLYAHFFVWGPTAMLGKLFIWDVPTEGNEVQCVIDVAAIGFFCVLFKIGLAVRSAIGALPDAELHAFLTGTLLPSLISGKTGGEGGGGGGYWG
jgi:hypothetical protein